MNKYSEIEIQTAQNLLKEGYKWIVRNGSGRLFAHFAKPVKVNYSWCSVGYISCVCNYVPIFQDIRSDDKEPTSLESIVHQQILDDAERRYLRAVIRPFRDKVRYISKVVDDIEFMTFKQGIVEGYTDCHLFIRFADASDDMSFPTFCEGEMYDGMERNKWYTLEELGL